MLSPAVGGLHNLSPCDELDPVLVVADDRHLVAAFAGLGVARMHPSEQPRAASRNQAVMIRMAFAPLGRVDLAASCLFPVTPDNRPGDRCLRLVDESD